MRKILVIGDTQCKPDEDLSYMSAIGNYIVSKRPDVIVHIGDNFDFPSLSTYDKGKRSFEGRRLKDDIEAGKEGLKLLLSPLKKLQNKQRQNKKKPYNPRLVFTLGNHENRFDRLAEDMPELAGYVGTNTLGLEGMGWEVVPFLKPIDIEGIYFVHYLANPMTGKPYGGVALNQLKTVGRSFVVGHKQCLDIAIRPTLDGKHQLGVVVGACLTPDHKVLTSDLRYIPLGDVKVGEEIVSIDEFPPEGETNRRFKTGKVLAHKIEKDVVFKVTLSDGTVFKVTNDHKWLVKTGSMYLWKETWQLRKGTRIPKVLDTWDTATSFNAGWLSGIYDGEGSYSARKSGNAVCAQMSVYQKEGLVLEKIKATLKELDLVPNYSIACKRDVGEIKVKGGVKNIAKLLGSIRPVRLLSKFLPEHLGALKTTSSENPTVVSIEPIGEMDIVRIAVDEKTMIVDGFVHHNCYPFDESYKGHQGNFHFRGVVMLHEVEDGFALPMPVSLSYLQQHYGENK